MRCPACGADNSWFRSTCKKCGVVLRKQEASDDVATTPFAPYDYTNTVVTQAVFEDSGRSSGGSDGGSSYDSGGSSGGSDGGGGGGDGGGGGGE